MKKKSVIEDKMIVLTEFQKEHSRENIERVFVSGNDVLLSQYTHQKIFGKYVKQLSQHPSKRLIVKITHNKNSIYRIWRGAIGIPSKNIVYIDKVGKKFLLNNEDYYENDGKTNKEFDITLSKGSLFMYYYNHFDNATRISFKFGFFSIILSLISIALTVPSFFI